MKKETDTRCDRPITGLKKGMKCKGAIFRDHRLSKMEITFGHRKYTCDKCGSSWKFID